MKYICACLDVPGALLKWDGGMYKRGENKSRLKTAARQTIKEGSKPGLELELASGNGEDGIWANELIPMRLRTLGMWAGRQLVMGTWARCNSGTGQ